MVTPDGNINAYIGTGWTVTGCDNGPAVNITVQKPLGLATDSAGNVYIADSQNDCIRMVTPGGQIMTVAGTGTAGVSGDGGPATSAKLNRPFSQAVDGSGDIFIADYNNSRIRMVTPDGTINTIAGGTGVGYTGDNTGIVATNARLNQPSSVVLDNAGHIYIADFANNVVRMLTPTGPSVASGGVISAQAFGAFPTVAPGSWIEIYGSNLSIDRRSWGSADFQGNTGPTSLDGTTVTIGGQAAYVDFISGGQINVQVPSGVPSGNAVAGGEDGLRELRHLHGQCGGGAARAAGSGELQDRRGAVCGGAVLGRHNVRAAYGRAGGSDVAGGEGGRYDHALWNRIWKRESQCSGRTDRAGRDQSGDGSAVLDRRSAGDDDVRRTVAGGGGAVSVQCGGAECAGWEELADVYVGGTGGVADFVYRHSVGLLATDSHG